MEADPTTQEGLPNMGHGCLAIVVLSVVAGDAAQTRIAQVRSPSFDIDYRVNEAALPLTAVQLWYSRDSGQSWSEYGYDEDGQPPFAFQAPDEGEFGFFLVLSNATGASSRPPPPNTPPQQRVFVDFTPPVVQLHPLRLATAMGENVVQLRWTAIDAHLTSRPIELYYRKPPDSTWLPIVPDAMANTGRFDWKVPENLNGSVAVRIAVCDLGGQRVESEAQVVEIPSLVAPAESLSARSPSPVAGDASEVSLTLPGSKRTKERVAKLFAEALALRDRGDVGQGISRLREVVKLDPQRTDAFSEMAGMLHTLGDHERALGAYDIALKHLPQDRNLLRGASQTYRAMKNYPAAAERLRTILRYNPADAEVWMNLGDLAVFQGDEVLARDCYNRATNIDPKATQVIAEARQRLALMIETSPNAKRTSK